MRLADKIVFLLLFGFLLFVGLNRHSRHPRFDYHSQIFTDKSGYHVYLPAFFYYEMDACKMPDNIVERTGRGYRLVDDKVVTKYPIGVALMHSPFFGIAALYDQVFQIKEEPGYSEAHHIALNWSTALYATLGLLLVWLTSVKFWSVSRSRAYLLVLLLLFVSNLLYYATRDAGMSHAYSFFTFSALQYLFYSLLSRKSVNLSRWFVVIFLCSLIIALRPLNGLFVVFPMAYFLWVRWSELKHVKFDMTRLQLTLGFLVGLLPILLQVAYNLYAFGGLRAHGYAAETFSNIVNLDLITFWFAPNNGVFMYIPILLLVPFWCFRQSAKGEYTSLIYLGYFLLISITYAAWWSPTLGCGFGHRGFTEHLAFFALPMIGVLKNFSKTQIKTAWLLSGLIAIYLFVWQWNFDGCWYGDSPWDWAEYFKMVGLRKLI